MLLLVLVCGSTRLKSLVDGASGTGIKFWSAMYIPIVVATFCLAEDLPLLHDDQDFLPFEEYLGLRSVVAS